MAGSIINVLSEELQRIWRYRWIVVAIALVLFFAAATHIMRMPDVYEASAQIYVNKETPVTAAAHDVSLVGDNFGSPYVVQKTLLNDQYLRNIIVQMDPSSAGKSNQDLSGEIESLRSRIKVMPGDDNDGFITIHYQASDPFQAYNVVRLLLDQFITANVSRNTNDLTKVTKFLDQQIGVYAAKLRESNQQMADFRRQHPEVANAGTPGMASDAAAAVASARAAYEAALSGGTRNVDTSAGQIATARARLAALRMQYTDRYPDVVAAQHELDSMIAANAAAASASPVTQSAAVERARDRLAAAQARLRRAEQGPAASQRDADWIDLQKSNALIRTNYEQMLSRREGARMSQVIYSDKNSGKYQVTNPPIVPSSPTGPDRRLFLLLAAAVSLAGGIAAAYLLGAINGILVAPRELEEAFGLPVAGTVSLEKTWETDGSKRTARTLTAMCLFVLVTGGATTGLVALKASDDVSASVRISLSPATDAQSFETRIVRQNPSVILKDHT